MANQSAGLVSTSSPCPLEARLPLLHVLPLPVCGEVSVSQVVQPLAVPTADVDPLPLFCTRCQCHPLHTALRPDTHFRSYLEDTHTPRLNTLDLKTKPSFHIVRTKFSYIRLSLSPDMDSNEMASHVQTPPPTRERGRVKRRLKPSGVAFAAVNTPSTIESARFNRSATSESVQHDNSWLKSNLDGANLDSTPVYPAGMHFSTPNSFMGLSPCQPTDPAASTPSWVENNYGDFDTQQIPGNYDPGMETEDAWPGGYSALSPTSSYALPPKGLMSIGPFSSPIKPTSGAAARPAMMTGGSFGHGYDSYHSSQTPSFVDPSLLTASSGRQRINIPAVPPKPTGVGEVIAYEHQKREYQREKEQKGRSRRSSATVSRASSHGSDAGLRARPSLHRSFTDSRVSKKSYQSFSRRSSAAGLPGRTNSVTKTLATLSGDLGAITSGIAGMSAPGQSSPTKRDYRYSGSFKSRSSRATSPVKEVSLKIDDKGHAYTVTTIVRPASRAQVAALAEDDTESEDEDEAASGPPEQQQGLQPSLMQIDETPMSRAEHAIDEIIKARKSQPRRPLPHAPSFANSKSAADAAAPPSRGLEAPFTTAADSATFDTSFDPTNGDFSSEFGIQQDPYSAASTQNFEYQPAEVSGMVTLPQVRGVHSSSNFSATEVTNCVCNDTAPARFMIQWFVLISL